MLCTKNQPYSYTREAWNQASHTHTQSFPVATLGWSLSLVLFFRWKQGARSICDNIFHPFPHRFPHKETPCFFRNPPLNQAKGLPATKKNYIVSHIYHQNQKKFHPKLFFQNIPRGLHRQQRYRQNASNRQLSLYSQGCCPAHSLPFQKCDSHRSGREISRYQTPPPSMQNLVPYKYWRSRDYCPDNLLHESESWETQAIRRHSENFHESKST